MKLVHIEWVDSCSTGGSPWCHVDGVRPGSVKCESVGWLLHDERDAKTIVAHQSFGNNDESLRQVAGDITIPTRAITRMRVLKK